VWEKGKMREEEEDELRWLMKVEENELSEGLWGRKELDKVVKR
jgi:hypothetical protein